MTDAAALLPDRLPAIDGVELAAAHLPGPEPCWDWYDAIPLPGETVGVAIADVTGRGAPAAALAGRLRRSLRARALSGDEPGQALQHLNSLVTDVSREMSTLLFAVFNPVTGELRGANAGHLPALIRRTGGAVEPWDAAVSLPLGVADDVRFGQDTVRLEPGDAVLLFTDGLIERRGAPIDDGFERLAEAVPLFGSADAVRTAVLEAMVGDDGNDDDVAVLALAVPPDG
jgi:chemotaxis family two-component system sensor kinase Cph1